MREEFADIVQAGLALLAAVERLPVGAMMGGSGVPGGGGSIFKLFFTLPV